MIIGIDVSTWQGKIDWNQVKGAGIHYAILRSSFGSSDPSQVDNQFENNYKGAKAAGIPVGAYHYGYAKVSKEERDRWGRLMESYFQEPGLISLGVLIVDARHKPTADDVTMFQWFRGTGCPVVVVANKLDKLKKSEIEPNLQLIRDTLELEEQDCLVPFSAEKGTGKNELLSAISQRLGV